MGAASEVAGGCRYASEAALGERLRAALADSEGFDEHAVAQ